METETAVMIVNVKNCQRCGKDHEPIAFKRLNNPTDEWVWWVMCPNANQPILLKSVESESK